MTVLNNIEDGIVNRAFLDMVDALGCDIRLTYVKKDEK